MTPSSTPPVITLTTDFGLADHYVGTMKGVILSRCPDARLVDISHELPPFSIVAGAYTIDQAAPYFAPGTVHLVVVDPGVGSARKPLLVEALGQYFVAPDNGVLSLIAARDRNARAYEISNRELWLPSPSSTFHGRDIFAPVAAAIASGAATGLHIGKLAAEMELLPDLTAVQMGPECWRGMVLSVDRFGNIITNLRASDCRRISSSAFHLDLPNGQVAAFRQTFAEAAEGLVFAYFGSSGYVEIGMNQESAAAQLGAAAGDRLTLRVTID